MYQMNYFLKVNGLTEAEVTSQSHDNTINVTVPKVCEFSPTERMDFIEKFVRMLVKGKINSV